MRIEITLHQSLLVVTLCLIGFALLLVFAYQLTWGWRRSKPQISIVYISAVLYLLAFFLGNFTKVDFLWGFGFFISIILFGRSSIKDAENIAGDSWKERKSSPNILDDNLF